MVLPVKISQLLRFVLRVVVLREKGCGYRYGKATTINNRNLDAHASWGWLKSCAYFAGNFSVANDVYTLSYSKPQRAT